MVAVLVFIYGIAVIYLASILKSIYHKYPETETIARESAGLSTDKVLILLLSVLMLILGLLLIPVCLGHIPFAPNAQLGLLMTIFAIQMMALGNTPVGPFPRNWLMFLLGLLFASLGIVSIIIPDILVSRLTVLVGLLNISGGIVSLWKTLTPLFQKGEKTQEPSHLILKKLFITQLTLGLLSVLFGTSMLVSNLLPGIVVGIILTANGAVLLYLLTILIQLEKLIENLA